MRRRYLRALWPLLALSAALVALSLPATSAQAVEARVQVVHPATIPSTDTILPTATTTAFDVALAQPHRAALTSFIASLSDTASPNYHRYLTPAQFGERFGATAATVAAVTSYFRGYGLHVGALSTGRIIVSVRGSTSQIARAFDAPVATVRLARGTIAAQFTSTATLPEPIGHDVVGVAGLSSVVPLTSDAIINHDVAHATGATSCAGASDGASASSTVPNNLGGYTLQQEAQLYGLDTAYAAGDTGVGQTIGIYELGTYDPSDVATYYSCYGITTNPTTINVDGGASGAYSDEATMDVEQTAGLAPGANIEVYAGPNSGNGPTDIYTQMADDDTATILTTSWGDCEVDPSNDPQAEEPIFEQMAAQGQTMIASAGDEGSSDCNGITNNDPAVDDPASQPYVTGVGGLTVTNITGPVETVWNDGTNSGGGASGGGQSQIWSRPSWQQAPGITASDTMRMVPDLSVIGDPDTGFVQYFTGSAGGFCHRSCSGGWGTIGGTSISSQLVGGLIAVSAQFCGVSRLGFINPTLYAMDQSGVGFTDVTTGNNDLFGEGVYSAGVGYDMASGLGSPDAGFITGICPAPIDVANGSLTPLSVTPSVGGTRPATLTLTLKDANGSPLVNTLVDVVASAASGTIVIDADNSSSTGSGAATYDITTNAQGVATITVSTTVPGPVVVKVEYETQTLYSSTLTFSNANSKSSATTPSAPSIARLRAVVGGFNLVVRPPATSGGSAVTAYQYSLNGGATWITFSRATRSVTITTLARGRRYSVSVRARNANGPGARSPSTFVTTLV
jgi:subtilase family serine protease